MHRYLIYVVNRGYSPSDRKELLGRFRAVSSDRLRVIDLRIGTGHMELDILADGDGVDWAGRYLDEVFGVIEVKEVVRNEESQPPEAMVREAVQLFDSERFWEAHEVLEGLWHGLRGKEKEVIHAIILLAAAYVHLQKDERETFTSMVGRARKALSDFEGNVFGLDVDALRMCCERAASEHGHVKLKPILAGS